jgi:hypothetical protein
MYTIEGKPRGISSRPFPTGPNTSPGFLFHIATCNPFKNLPSADLSYCAGWFFQDESV